MRWCSTAHTNRGDMSGSTISPASSPAALGSVAEPPHRPRLPGAVAALGLAAVAGVVVAMAMPRGPAAKGTG
jgi:hypothetical protein